MTVRKKRTTRKKVVKRVFRGSTKNALRKNASVKRARKIITRKRNRQDIHQIVRDHIRAGRNQKQILDLMKRAGFKKEYLAEARKIYNSEKQLVRRMKTGRNPCKEAREIISNIQHNEKKIAQHLKAIQKRGSDKAAHRRSIAAYRDLIRQAKSELARLKNPSKVLSTVKRVAVKAGKTAIGVVRGVIKGEARAAKGNPRRKKNTGAFDSVVQHIRDRDPHSRDFMVDTIARDISYGDHTSIQAQRELIKAGMSRKSAGALVRKAQTRGRLWEQGVGDLKERAKRKKKAKRPKSKSSFRKRNSSTAEQQRKEFAGHFDGYHDLYYPSTNPPKEPSKLGELKSIRTSKADFTPIKGSMWLCRDSAGRLHIGTTREGEMFAGPVQDLGVVERIEYLERKPHLGDYQLTEYYHRMGEENGIKPHLWSDGKGGLVFRGGDYRIESRGIVN